MLEQIIELIDSRQYRKLREMLTNMVEADIAEIFDELSNDYIVKIFRILPKSDAADIFSYLQSEDQQYIINSLTDKEAATIIDNLAADDAADLLEEFPASVVKRLLSQTTPETRRDINHLLQYPEDSAGSIMTVEFIDLKEYYTVQQSLEVIRREGIDKETINTCYVLNPRRKLIGTISLRKLLLSDPAEVIGNLMHENIVTVQTLDDQEDVARAFQKYDFTTMPVVDSEGRLVGIITVDDIVDIMEQEATEDIEMMAAITPTDKPYLKVGIFETFKTRIPWLLLLMISSAFTTKIIQSYEDALASCVVLSSFMPLLMGTGGNAGGQVSVTVIRGLSLDEIELRDILKVIWKESRVAVLCGVTLAVINFGKMMLVDRVTVAVGLVVSISMAFTVLFAKVVGGILPMLAKRVGFDPAVMASPFITTIVDAASLMIYFQFAKMFLGL